MFQTSKDAKISMNINDSFFISPLG